MISGDYKSRLDYNRCMDFQRVKCALCSARAQVAGPMDVKDSGNGLFDTCILEISVAFK